jgi:hypothetical protein
MASLKVPNLGKKENLRQRSAQNSNKGMKRIDLRQNFMKNGSRTMNLLVYDTEEMKMRCMECADFYGEKIKTKKF